MPRTLIRPAVPDDAEVLLDLIREFAAFDGRLDRVEVDATKLKNLLCGPSALITFVLAESDGVVSGFASYYLTYSTALARPGLCLEDLFIRENGRGAGIGAALMRYIDDVANKGKCAEIEWTVGIANERAKSFYASLGAVFAITYRSIVYLRPRSKR